MLMSVKIRRYRAIIIIIVVVVVLGCWTMLNDVGCEIFNLFVTKISKNLFVPSFQ